MNRISIILPTTRHIHYIIYSFIGTEICFANFSLGSTLINYQLNEFHTSIVITSKKLLKQRNIIIDDSYKNIFVDTVYGVCYLFWRVILGRLMINVFNHRDLFLSRHLYLFTSGSTGAPKLIKLPIQKIYENISGWLQYTTLEPGNKFLCVLPYFHSFGLNTGLIFPLLQKTGIITQTNLEFFFYPYITNPEGFSSYIYSKGIQYFCIAPYFLKLLLTFGTTEQLSSVLGVFVGGDYSDTSLIELFYQRISHAHYYKGYGMTECYPVVSFNPMRNNQHSTDGKLLPHLSYLIKQDDNTYTSEGSGILLIDSKYCTKNNDNDTIHINKTAYFNTHDYVSIDQDKFLTLIARDKRIIKKGGELLNIEYLQQYLRQNSSYQDIVCIGNDDKIYCFVTKELAINDINSYIVQEGLSPLYKIAKLFTISQIPMISIGKTNYQELYSYIKLDGTED